MNLETFLKYFSLMADVGKVSVYFCNNSAGSCNNIEYIMLPFQGPVSSRGAVRGEPKIFVIDFLYKAILINFMNQRLAYTYLFQTMRNNRDRLGYERG